MSETLESLLARTRAIVPSTRTLDAVEAIARSRASVARSLIQFPNDRELQRTAAHIQRIAVLLARVA